MTLARLGTPAPWLFPGQSPARPAADVLFGVRLQRHGINAHAGRNTVRLALAAELPASVLADLTGISISTAERWSRWAKRDWTSYIGQRAADVQAEAPAARAGDSTQCRVLTASGGVPAGPWTPTASPSTSGGGIPHAPNKCPTPVLSAVSE